MSALRTGPACCRWLGSVAALLLLVVLPVAPEAHATPDPGPLLFPVKRLLLRVNAPTCDKVASTSGDDADLGDVGGPYRTVQRLLDSLGPGQTGCLRGGTYDTQEHISMRTRDVILTSYPNERATIRGLIVVFGQGDKIESLNLDGTCPSGACVDASPKISAADVAILSNNITNRNSICVHPTADNGLQKQPDRVVIAANRIHDCGQLPPTNHHHGIYIADGTGAIVYENVIYDNADRGVQLYPNVRGALVYHNTIDGNGEGVNLGANAAENTISENLITNSNVRWNMEWPDLTGAGNALFDNCLYASNGNAFYNQMGGTQNAEHNKVVLERNPVSPDGTIYTNRGAKDFRVRFTSKCAGYGALGPEAGP